MMIIRPATLDDIQQIQVVRRSVVENALSDPSKIRDSDVADFLTSRGKGWVCESDDRIIGFAIADLVKENIWALFVLPAYEGKGAGSRLHDVMLEWYFKQGKKRVWLSTTPETRAERFYRSKGWKETGSLKNGELVFEWCLERDPVLAVRELQTADIPDLVRYWSTAKPAFLASMGVDLKKLPPGTELTRFLTTQLQIPLEERFSYALTWLINGVPSGHSNANDIAFGRSAYMHLHLWQTENRQKGMGVELIRRSLPFYFERLQLKTLYCQPFALNPAPNKALSKVGFEFMKRYITTPGTINFEQEVNLYRMTLDRYRQMYLQDGRPGQPLTSR